MLCGMSQILDAWWRAAAYCLHPRVILLSLLPVLVAGGMAFGLAWLYWEPAVEGVRTALDDLAWLAPVTGWLNDISAGAFRSVVGPLVVVALAAPVVLLASLLLVSFFMGSAITHLVGQRRFPSLERRHGGSLWGALLNATGATLWALLLLVLSVPLWLIPPLALVLPPLIWGWLSYRLMTYDALAEHASRDERRTLMRLHRWPLLAMGLVTGYMGAAPSLVWATGALALPMMPLMLPGFIWLYTLVFAFASAWFTHYGLTALQHLRQDALRTEAALQAVALPTDPAGTLPQAPPYISPPL